MLDHAFNQFKSFCQAFKSCVDQVKFAKNEFHIFVRIISGRNRSGR